jgi:hypothetical protein
MWRGEDFFRGHGTVDLARLSPLVFDHVKLLGRAFSA